MRNYRKFLISKLDVFLNGGIDTLLSITSFGCSDYEYALNEIQLVIISSETLPCLMTHELRENKFKHKFKRTLIYKGITVVHFFDTIGLIIIGGNCTTHTHKIQVEHTK